MDKFHFLIALTAFSWGVLVCAAVRISHLKEMAKTRESTISWMKGNENQFNKFLKEKKLGKSYGDWVREKCEELYVGQ